MTAPIASSSGPSAAPENLSDAEAYLLLTIPNVTTKQFHDNQSMLLARGELRIECVSLPIPPEIGRQSANPFAPSPSDPPNPTHDFWLVLKIGDSFEKPLVPGHELEPVPQPVEGVQYNLPSTKRNDMWLNVVLPKPSSSADLEDLESLEILLRQYKSLGEKSTALEGVQAAPLGSSSRPKPTRGLSAYDELPQDVRGKLIIVNEDNGEIIGQMDQTVDLEASSTIAGTNKDQPVVLDFGGEIDGLERQKVTVKTIREEDMDDWMLRGAHNISKGILSFGGWSSKMMNAGSEAFIRNSTPRAEPVKFSPATKNNIRRAHNASVKSANVTKKTVDKINDKIGQVIDTGFETQIHPRIDAYKKRRDSRNSQSGSASLGSSSGTGSPSPSVTPRPKAPSPSLLPRSETLSPTSPGGQTGGVSPSELDDRLASAAQTKVPPVPSKPLHLSSNKLDSPSSNQGSPVSRRPAPPVPYRQPGAGSDPSFIGRQITIPEDSEVLAQEIMPPPYIAEPEGISSPSQQPTFKQKAKVLFKRIVTSAEVVLTSVESATSDIVTTGTEAAAKAAHHKYGAEAGQATALLGGSVRNVVVMYVDARGVGRKAIVKRTAKGMFKGTMNDGEQVELVGEGEKAAGVVVGAGEVEKTKDGEVVIGLPQVGGKLQLDEKEQGYDVSRGGGTKA